jgi:hypothetical protein
MSILFVLKDYFRIRSFTSSLKRIETGSRSPARKEKRTAEKDKTAASSYQKNRSASYYAEVI